MTSLKISSRVSLAHRILLCRSAQLLVFHHDLPASSLSAHYRNNHTCVSELKQRHLNSASYLLRVGEEKCVWLRSSRYLATKPKGSIQEVADKQAGQVTVAKKVAQAGKDVTYLGVIIVGVCITGLMFFTVGKELFSSKSPNVVYTRALKRCKNSDEVTSVFGLPLKGYGEMTRRRRRRHVSKNIMVWGLELHFEYEKDGVMYMRVKFYIEGPDKKGTVNCEVRECSPISANVRSVLTSMPHEHVNRIQATLPSAVKNESGAFEYRYLFVDVDGYPPQTIVLEDNR